MDFSQDNWPTLALVAVIAFIVGRMTVVRVTDGGASVADIESTVAGLSSDARLAVEAKIREGKFIEGVKLMRERTGMGLRDSKLACDRIKAGLSS